MWLPKKPAAGEEPILQCAEPHHGHGDVELWYHRSAKNVLFAEAFFRETGLGKADEVSLITLSDFLILRCGGFKVRISKDEKAPAGSARVWNAYYHSFSYGQRLDEACAIACDLWNPNYSAKMPDPNKPYSWDFYGIDREKRNEDLKRARQPTVGGERHHFSVGDYIAPVVTVKFKVNFKLVPQGEMEVELSLAHGCRVRSRAAGSGARVFNLGQRMSASP